MKLKIAIVEDNATEQAQLHSVLDKLLAAMVVKLICINITVKTE